MSTHIWTKMYDLITKEGNFRILISEHKGVCFYASCLYFEGERMLRTSSQMGSIEFKLEKKYATSEEEAFKLITDWARNKFGNGVEIREKS